MKILVCTRDLNFGGAGQHIQSLLKEFDEIREIEIFFKAADLVLLPYKYFEAQSGVGTLVLPFEKPMIVSKTGGLPELVLDKRAIVPPENPKQLAKAIDNIFSDEELYSKLVSDSKKLRAKLSWNNIVKDYTRRLY